MSDDTSVDDGEYTDADDNLITDDDLITEDDAQDDAQDDGDAEFAPSAVAVLEYLVQSVVDDPSAVNVDVDEGGRRPALNVTVGDGDMGRVIGKRGRVAQSIRTVTRAAAAQDGVEIDIEFLD